MASLLNGPASAAVDERCPLIAHPVADANSSAFPHSETQSHRVAARVANRLYVSHFLSTWNTRVFEFGAVLYLASIFPGTLLPMSVYALTRGTAAIIFSSAVGQYIDTGNRLRVVRLSIVLQRLVVAGSLVIFYILAIGLPLAHGAETGLLVLLALLACVEILCAIMNLVSVERDWYSLLPVLLTVNLVINARMRRIDLICKLIGPLFIALIDGISTEVAILVNLGMNVASVAVEYFAIAKVYYEVPELQRPKRKPREELLDRVFENESHFAHNWRHVQMAIKKSSQDFSLYFHHPAFLPSFAGALLYLTVLSFSGQMVTYLLSAGYSAAQIGIARTLSVAFEVLSTWVAPWLMGRIGPIRAGIWLVNWQIVCLVAGIAVFWALLNRPTISASGLVGGTILSRLGLRGFDLCIQIIIQEDVEATHRGSFSTVEAAWQNAFELCSFVSTIIFSRPEQFKWPVLLSVVAVVTAGVLYTIFVYLRRGHLLHLAKWKDIMGSQKGRQRSREEGIQRIASSSDM
ncbi:Uncharacterized protein BP5553_06526 [Venustampulla echinocandica]|uniref:Solute carrier family 40 member n=1 Tax=Venustampulla echinocandica TaxID=2656787 RepID=A0A370TK69_9HELO|nr:Uncharacterized protein BP5553_06526 [Venustampulla echinocandica]RDL35914.1 Uncharacterized protein BP5553_06526 [Venustampulla echinocandica]